MLHESTAVQLSEHHTLLCSQGNHWLSPSKNVSSVAYVWPDKAVFDSDCLLGRLVRRSHIPAKGSVLRRFFLLNRISLKLAFAHGPLTKGQGVLFITDRRVDTLDSNSLPAAKSPPFWLGPWQP